MHVYKRLIIFISSSNNVRAYLLSLVVTMLRNSLVTYEQFKYLRNVMESLVEESAFGASTTSLKGNSVACIPFIGKRLIVLSALTRLIRYRGRNLPQGSQHDFILTNLPRSDVSSFPRRRGFDWIARTSC